MPRRIVDAHGAEWVVTLTGRRTQYARDEISLAFTPGSGNGNRSPRFARFSPRGAKAPETAYEEVSDTLLLRLLAISQPAWTSPDGGYAPTG